VNGDGNADVIVGAYRGQSGPLRTDPATGYVRVFSGADGSLLYQVNGLANGDQFGRAVAAADVTGDGVADVIAGARWGANGGYVQVIDGPTGTVVDQENAAQAFDWLGSSVAAGDIDLNGKANVGAGDDALHGTWGNVSESLAHVTLDADDGNDDVGAQFGDISDTDLVFESYLHHRDL
jgi:hypothetical protein